MSVFTTEIEVGDSEARTFERVDALVDTGASYTLLPGSMLRSLGIEPHTGGRFLTAEGKVIERELGRAWVRIDGRSEMTIVIFGDEDARPLLGAVTLEEFGLGVDPLGHRLIPVPGYLV
jgi:aspartyl protease family protein